MARESKSAQEIQAEVSRLIHEGKEVREDGTKIKVPLPIPLAPGVVEPHGSNWTMHTFGNAGGYEGWVLHVLYKVQSMWNLEA